MTSELSQVRTNLAGQPLENPVRDRLGAQPVEWEVGRCTFELTIGANGRLRATAQDTFRHAQAGEVGPNGRIVWRCHANPQQFTGR
jgi:hypothetical protein